MKRFKFRLQRVLELKERAEQERARALGQAREEEQARLTELESAAARLDAAGAAVKETGGGAIPAGTLRNLGLTVEAAQQRLQLAEEEHRGARETAQAEQTRFDGARKDRRAVERLKEKRQGAWHEEDSRGEQKDLDQVAARRWTEGNKS